MKKHRALALALALSLLATVASRGRAEEEPRTVDITAKRFEFVPATLTLKRGETVLLRVKSEDVIHGLFSREFKLDADLEPGKTQEFTVTPQNAGQFAAICHHFCGAGHANMRLTIVVE